MLDEEELPLDGDDELAARRAATAKRSGTVSTLFAPTPVATKLCRRCRVPVEVTEAGLSAFETFSKRLVADGKPPLLDDQVMICDACRRLVVEKSADNARKVCDRMAAAVRRLRDGGTDEQERAAAEYLEIHANDGAATVKHWREKRQGKTAEGGDF